jgi:hypothetical protein
MHHHTGRKWTHANRPCALVASDGLFADGYHTRTQDEDSCNKRSGPEEVAQEEEEEASGASEGDTATMDALRRTKKENN